VSSVAPDASKGETSICRCVEEKERKKDNEGGGEYVSLHAHAKL
jgi:hypothetical protein